MRNRLRDRLRWIQMGNFHYQTNTDIGPYQVDGSANHVQWFYFWCYNVCRPSGGGLKIFLNQQNTFFSQLSHLVKCAWLACGQENSSNLDSGVIIVFIALACSVSRDGRVKCRCHKLFILYCLTSLWPCYLLYTLCKILKNTSILTHMTNIYFRYRPLKLSPPQMSLFSLLNGDSTFPRMTASCGPMRPPLGSPVWPQQ